MGKGKFSLGICSKCRRRLGYSNNSGICGECSKTLTGEDAHSWKGNNVKKLALHVRVRAARGKPTKHECFWLCGYMAQTWAQIHGTDGLELVHYVPACYTCHNEYDNPAEKKSEWLKKLWADPLWRAERTRRVREGVAKRGKH